MKKYISIIRVDNWVKNIFIIPGVLMGLIFGDQLVGIRVFFEIILGIFATCLIASANYVINEWLDRNYDKFHPVKKYRSSVSQDLNPNIIYALYFLLLSAGLAISSLFSLQFFTIQLLLVVMGLMYNVPPFRTKDIAYIDVATESINNPIRFLLGWFLVTASILPPSSVLIAYWAGGGFLMALKRYAEYRKIGDKKLAVQYRRSFRGYSESSLLGSVVFYASLSSFFLGIFLIKYRVEYLLIFPFISLLFTYYFILGLKPDSPVQYPERLYLENKLGLCVILVFTVFVLLTFFDLPIIHFLLEKNDFIH